jgi:hypothetical protein
MRPARRIKQAEELAVRLRVLLSGSTMSQLLQHPPPAALTAEQEAQLLSCSNLMSQLTTALDEASSLSTQLIDAVLKQQAAYHVGSLVAWVQQQPEQQLSELRVVAAAWLMDSAPVAPQCAAIGRTCLMWDDGVQLLQQFAWMSRPENAGACNLAASLTQQLDQSGKACSCNCKGTAR